MKCPTCPDSDLTMSERQGIEIDYCPKCRGVWLDRGELDKILERSGKSNASGANGRHKDLPQKPDGHCEKQHKRKSFWTELFD